MSNTETGPGPPRIGRYRMPVVFGPSPGPRQGPDGQTFDYADAPRTIAAVSFLTDAALLSRYLPPRCVLAGDPVVTVEHVHLHDLAWLAGRDYSLLQVKYPVVYQGAEAARGPFLAVLWENRPEPILTGREELGFAKLYGELPPPRNLDGGQEWVASWDGHVFCRMSLRDLADAEPPGRPTNPDGVIHHRYVPQVSAQGADAIDEMVISPAGANMRYDRYQRAVGTVEFVSSTWEQLPTMFHIVNALAGLPKLEMRGSFLAHTRGASDLSDQRVLT